MAQDEVSLYNLALSAAGTRARISSPAENSREAEICRLWFEPVRRQVLRAAPWGSARAMARLALKTERTEEIWAAGMPNPAYRFAYGLPVGYLQARYLYGYARFELSLIATNEMALMTEVENAILYYTMDQKEISLWDPDLYLAISQALGAYISQPLNGKSASAARAQQQANGLIYSAREAAANESFEPIETVPDWISIRGSAFSAPSSRYIYPSGPIVAVPNV